MNAKIFNLEKWSSRLSDLRERYRQAEPYPSIVLDNFLEPAPLSEVLAAFPPTESTDWTHYTHVNERKLAQTKREILPAAALRVIDCLNSPPFVAFLSQITGIPKLMSDDSLEGGGLHQSCRGGFLNIHADFTAHPHRKRWARRVNLIVYLNKDWEESYGGHLQLWDRQAKGCVKQILPIFNRGVIFSTDPDCFHGHPEPLTCPADQTRKSIALYYFTEESATPFTRSTEYRSKPDDPPAKKLLIFADKWGLRGFDWAKRRFGLSDRFAHFFLRRFSK